MPLQTTKFEWSTAWWRPSIGLACLLWSFLGCQGSKSSPGMGDDAAMVSGGLDASRAQDRGPDTDTGTPLDNSSTPDVGSLLDSTPNQDVMATDANLGDAQMDSGGDPCEHRCLRDDDCAPSEECEWGPRPGCESDRRDCADRCENHLFRAPRELKCCTGEMAIAPVCTQGAWHCPEGAGQFESIAQGCGPGTNIPEEGVYCGVGANPDLCAPDLFCCVGVLTNCTNNRDASCYFHRDCDGPEDCGGTDICCAYEADTTRPRYASACRPAAECVGEDHLITCNTPADCPGAQSCCAESINGFNTAICRPSCFAGP